MLTETHTIGSHDHLISELTAIRNTGWNTRRANQLLDLASKKLASAARREGMQPADAAAAAWEAWRAPGAAILQSDNAWGWTTAAVKRELARESQAQRLLTSKRGLRRTGIEDADFEQFVEIDAVADIPAARSTDTGERPVFHHPALLYALALLITSGRNAVEAALIVEAIAEAGAVSATAKGAAERLRKGAPEIAKDHAISEPQLRALIAVIFGNDRGAAGLITNMAEAEGKQVRNAEARFHRANAYCV